jgi:hypothetical protein
MSASDWALLGLEPGATEDELRKAWKKVALKHHPDRNPDDPEAEGRFKSIKQAYDRLLEGGGEVGAVRGMDPDWFDAVQWMAEHRRNVVLTELLPRFYAHYGKGHALTRALLDAKDLEAAAAELPDKRKKLRVDLDVLVDASARAWSLVTLMRTDTGALVTLHPVLLWGSGVRDEDAARPIVFDAVGRGLAAALPVALGLPPPPDDMERALARDRLQRNEKLFWRSVWAAVGLFGVMAIGGSIFGFW